MKWFFLCRGQGALRAQFCRRGFPGIFFSRNSWLNTQVLRTLKYEIKESKASWKKKKTLKNVSLNISWKSFKASNHLNLRFFFFFLNSSSIEFSTKIYCHRIPLIGIAIVILLFFYSADVPGIGRKQWKTAIIGRRQHGSLHRILANYFFFLKKSIHCIEYSKNKTNLHMANYFDFKK